MKFSETQRNTILTRTGEPVPVKLNGVLIKNITAKAKKEEIIESGIEAEIGKMVQTLILDETAYATLDKTKKYTFVIDGVNHIARGPALQDGSGFVKLMLVKS